MNKSFSAILLLSPFLVLAGWSMYYMSFTRESPEVVLPIRGYDPRNLLSGHYIQFQIDWNKADCNQADWNGVCPRSSFRGIDRYYVPENDARPLERKINEGVSAQIVFSYQQGKRPIAKKLLIGDKPREEDPQDPNRNRISSRPNRSATLESAINTELQENQPQDLNYENRLCGSQAECGGVNSGYFCNAGGMHTPNRCEKTTPAIITTNGQEYYYNKYSDLKSWCRMAYESQSDRDDPNNCNWGYLSYDSARSWCASIGKHLVYAEEIEQNCERFNFLPKANPDQQYWTEDMTVVHMGQNCSIQRMVRGDGYIWAGGVICK